MKRPLRRLGLLLAALLALFVLTAAVLPFVVDVDRFRPRLQATLAELLGRPVTLGRLRLSLWTGVALRADRVEVRSASGPGLVAGPVRLRPALLPLLRGGVDLRGIVADAVTIARDGRPLLEGGRLRARFSRTSSGDLDLEGTLDGTWMGIPQAPAGTLSFAGAQRGERIDLRRLDVDVGPIRLDLTGHADGVGTGASRWSVQGSGSGPGSTGKGEGTLAFSPGVASLDFAFDFERVDFAELAALATWASAGGAAAAPPSASPAGAPLSHQLRGGGTLRARRASFSGLDLEDLATRVEIGGGVVRLRDAAFALYGGTQRGTLTLNALAEALPFTLVSRIQGVDVGRLLGAWSPGSAGVFRGTGSVDLDLAGQADAPEVLPTLGGTMRLAVRDGALTTVGILETVASLLEAAGGRGIGRDETPFRTLDGSFALTAGVARTQDLAVVADDLRLDVRGDVDLRGPLALEGLVAFSPEVSASMVRETSALRVRQGEDGRLTVPLAVGGTLSAPRVQVDLKRIVREGVREETRHALEQKVEKTKKKLLDRLFR